jgi:hypothetical protein
MKKDSIAKLQVKKKQIRRTAKQRLTVDWTWEIARAATAF